MISTATAAGLIAASVLGTATAQSPVSGPPRTVAVQGSASAAISSAADGDAANSAYRQGLVAAVSDGQSKAAFLAGRVGGGLGPVQSVSEGGGYIDCGDGDYNGSSPTSAMVRSARPFLPVPWPPLGPLPPAVPESRPERRSPGVTRPRRARRRPARSTPKSLWSTR